MQNAIQTFENDAFGQIRVIKIDGKPWWVLKDVCSVLELKSPHKVALRLDEDERNQIPLIDGMGRMQDTTIINESGLYAVILRSEKPKAKDFRRWITSEVLPSIRKYGVYANDDILRRMREDSEFADDLIRRLSAEREKTGVLLDYVEHAAPKVRYYDTILQCPDAVQVSIIAKDYGMTAIAFNKLLHRLGIQFKVGKT